VLAAVAAPCVEVGPGVSGLPAVGDARLGPLVALAAGVAAVGPRPALVVACDLPLLTAELLRWVADHPAPGSAVPLWGGAPQPLCARWSAPALASVGGLVAGGARSLRPLLDFGDVTLVSPPASLAEGMRDVDEPGDLDAIGGIDSP
jgi:molybdopterin-guanine dinucleotide biosynthesis protein A